MISFIYINKFFRILRSLWAADASMDVTSFEILFSVSPWIFQIDCLENGDAKAPLIIRSHFD